MQERYAAPVIGPSALFPRGYLWLAPVWFAAAGAALALARWPPPWYRLSAAAGLAGSLVTFMTVLATLRSNAFLADSGGLWLGTRSGARRRWRRGRIRYLPWTEISRLRLRAAVFGAVVEVVLCPDAPVRRSRPVLRAAGSAGRWLLLLALPLACVFCRPGLASGAGYPPRYRIPIRAVSAAELGPALRALAPPDVTVVVVRRRMLRRSALPVPAPRPGPHPLPLADPRDIAAAS